MSGGINDTGSYQIVTNQVHQASVNILVQAQGKQLSSSSISFNATLSVPAGYAIILSPGGNGGPNAPGVPLQFYPVSPCRVADTRTSEPFMGAFGPPSLAASGERDFPIQSSPCGIPSTAQAYSLNFTAVPSGPLSFLSTWPTGDAYPGVSTLNSSDGSIIATLPWSPREPAARLRWSREIPPT